MVSQSQVMPTICKWSQASHVCRTHSHPEHLTSGFAAIPQILLHEHMFGINYFGSCVCEYAIQTYAHFCVFCFLCTRCCFLSQAGSSCRRSSAHDQATSPPLSLTPSVSEPTDQTQWVHDPTSSPAHAPIPTPPPSHAPILATDPNTWSAVNILQRPKAEGRSEQQGAVPSSAPPHQLGSTHLHAPAPQDRQANR